jgi:hypothetical protein
MAHQSSQTMEKLMQNAINMSSSFIALLFQLHMKTLHLVTLSNFMYKMKLSKHCYGATGVVT